MHECGVQPCHKQIVWAEAGRHSQETLVMVLSFHASMLSSCLEMATETHGAGHAIQPDDTLAYCAWNSMGFGTCGTASRCVDLTCTQPMTRRSRPAARPEGRCRLRAGERRAPRLRCRAPGRDTAAASCGGIASAHFVSPRSVACTMQCCA